MIRFIGFVIRFAIAFTSHKVSGGGRQACGNAGRNDITQSEEITPSGDSTRRGGVGLSLSFAQAHE